MCVAVSIDHPQTLFLSLRLEREYYSSCMGLYFVQAEGERKEGLPLKYSITQLCLK